MAGPPCAPVNVSPIQLRHRDFIDILCDALRTNEEPPAIGIEITESVIMEDIDATVAKLRDPRHGSQHCPWDDFGTGYSPLSYLAKLPGH